MILKVGDQFLDPENIRTATHEIGETQNKPVVFDIGAERIEADFVRRKGQRRNRHRRIGRVDEIDRDDFRGDIGEVRPKLLRPQKTQRTLEQCDRAPIARRFKRAGERDGVAGIGERQRRAKPGRAGTDDENIDRGIRLGQILPALVDRHVEAFARAGVKLARPADLLARILDHFLPLGDPAGGARNGEKHSEHGGREAHRLQRDARVEIDIRIELLLDEIFIAERDLLELHRDIEQRVVFLACSFEDRVTRLLHELGARIVIFIDAMAEAHKAE